MRAGTAFARKRDALARQLQRLKSTWVHPGIVAPADGERLLGKALEREYSLADLLRRPGVGYDQVAELAALWRPDVDVSRETLRAALGTVLADAVIEQAEISFRYAGYIDKQQEEVERAAHYERSAAAGRPGLCRRSGAVVRSAAKARAASARNAGPGFAHLGGDAGGHFVAADSLEEGPPQRTPTKSVGQQQRLPRDAVG